MLRPIFNFLGFSRCHDCRSTAEETDCDSRVVRFDHKESDIYQKRVSSKIVFLKVWNLANRSIVLSPESFEHVPIYEDFIQHNVVGWISPPSTDRSAQGRT